MLLSHQPNRSVNEGIADRGFYNILCNLLNTYNTRISYLLVICHGIPDKRPLQDGDIVNLDVTCYYNGFHGDLNATYLVGNVDEQGRKLVQTARECLEKAIAAVKPGMKYREFGKIIEAHAAANGFSVVRTFCGHGINQLFHCSPNVPHYASTCC